MMPVGRPNYGYRSLVELSYVDRYFVMEGFAYEYRSEIESAAGTACRCPG